MAGGIRSYVRTPPSKDPDALIRWQLDNREAIFLDMVRRVVFEDSSHPYLEMFRMAGCTHADLAELVKTKGLESSLAQIHREGVYLHNDELKGMTPIVRGGREINASSRSFRNPIANATIRGVSSGGRGQPFESYFSPQFYIHADALHSIVSREFALQDHAHIILRSTLPSTVGLMDCAAGVRAGQRMDRWYAFGVGGHYSTVTSAMVLAARFSGCRIPFPTYLPDNDFSAAAERVSRLSAAGIPCVVRGPASPSVRLAAAAIDRGLDIRGTLFLMSGEALTDAKRSVVESAGGRIFARYGMSEFRVIGHGCRQMTEGNCVHPYTDSLAVISYRRRAPMSEVDVHSLLLTTLLPSAPNFLINFEPNDHGILEPSSCDCEFSRIGFRWRIRDIFSFSKLSGQGMTLIGTDLVRLLEEVLPARIGGRPGDYQLIEREGAAQTSIELRVSPRVTGSSPDRIRDCFLDEIRRIYGGLLASRVWRHAEAVQVVMAEPVATATGKIHPLHLLNTATERLKSP
jgi:hypothetical protein